jgi:hypothetical protein
MTWTSPPGKTGSDDRQHLGFFVEPEWQARAVVLADWTLARLTNRTDCWGGYRPLAERGREYTRSDGSKSNLSNSTTRKGKLTRGLLIRHYRGATPEHVLGLHSTSPDNTCLTGALDIDRHDNSPIAAEVTEAAALAWFHKLQTLGFCPLLTDSNGRGGFHLRALFCEPVPSAKVYAFLRWLVADHASYGLTAPPETFPKQPRLAEGRFGNWLRLPGRHHTREHWARVWDGSSWLDGAAAVEHLLALRGNSPLLIPTIAESPSPNRRMHRPTILPRFEGDALGQRVAAYLSRLPNLSEGQGRDDLAYQFAAFLVRDLSLTDDVALGWLERWDAGNSPPKGSDRLRDVIASAHAYGHRAYGSGLLRKIFRCARHHHDVIRFVVEI